MKTNLDKLRDKFHLGFRLEALDLTCEAILKDVVDKYSYFITIEELKQLLKGEGK